jgi:hypothetical protein
MLERGCKRGYIRFNAEGRSLPEVGSVDEMNAAVHARLELTAATHDRHGVCRVAKLRNTLQQGFWRSSEVEAARIFIPSPMGAGYHEVRRNSKCAPRCADPRGSTNTSCVSAHSCRQSVKARQGSHCQLDLEEQV